MEKEIRLSFFKRLKMSIFDFDKYHIIASEGLGRAMMYLVKLILLFSLTMSLASIFKISQIISEATNYIQTEVPNFYFKDNIFYLDSDNDISIENNEYINFKVILSNAETFDEEQVREFDGIELVLLKDKLLFKQSNSTSIVTQSYNEIQEIYDINSLNKDTIVGFFNGENGYNIFANIFAFVFITAFLTYFMTAILDTIALSLLGFIITRIIRLPLKYSSIYSIGISSITLSVIINLIYMIVNLFTGFVIPYFQIMYTLVSYVYLIAALFIMKSEILKKKVKIRVEIMNKEKNEDKIDEYKKENKPNKEKDNNDNKEEENLDNKKDNKKTKLKDKVDGKINNKGKDNPEPQANMRER